MKLLAVLKDSYYEALDSKVFFVMAGLSGLLTLVIASVSFRPVTFEEELKHLTGILMLMSGMAFQADAPQIDVVDFQQVNDAAEPWRGDYRFTVRVQFPDDMDAKPRRRGARPVTAASLRELIRQQYDWLDNVQVIEAPSDDPRQERYLVTTRGTKIDDPLAWPHEPKIFFAVPLSFLHVSLRTAVYWIEDALINGTGAWVALLVGVIITASYVPNMLRKGGVDLLLSKPIRRPTLLLYKYVGGLTFVFLLTAGTVLAIWLVLGLRTGLWAPGFLLVIPILTFYFAILYAVSCLLAVLTRSTVVALLVTCMVWFIFWINGTVHTFLETIHKVEGAAPTLPGWVQATSDVFYTVLPRTSDLNHLTTNLISRGVLTEAEIHHLRLDLITPPPWAPTLAVSGGFIALMLGLACWRFARRDY
jgi:ABC-type transport system involved in multi-copper enzyme maturation permease subunit